MKLCICLLAVGLFASSPALRAEEAPIIFARSGQKATLPVGGEENEGRSVALAAYAGIGKPVAVKNHAAEFLAPRVRVASVFRLVSLRDGKVALLPGELVVYPAPAYHEERPVQYVAAAAPDWFNTWSDAVGLPVREFPTRESLGAGHWRMLEKPGLLIVGPEKGDKSNYHGRAGVAPISGPSPKIGRIPISRLAAEYKINVLVLETDWYAANETAARETALSPKQMTGPLADLQTRNWLPSPTFRLPAVRVLNCRTWIAGVEHPLVEEIRGRERGTESLRTVFSYLPWQKQLGRSEASDELFFRLLAETAKGAADRRPLDGRWRLLWPEAKGVKADARPVLAAALKSAVTGEAANDPGGIGAYVLDLRGKAPPPAELFEAAGPLQKIESRIAGQTALLILGDNPALDAWEWLKLDRPGRRSLRPGVLWCPGAALPADLNEQLRLMEFFTERNVFLGD